MRPEHRDPSHPIHLSPNRPPPRLGLGKTFPTTTPDPLAWAKAIALGWASTSSAPSLAPLALSWFPRPGQPPPSLPRNWTFLPNQPKGLGKPTQPSRERPFPTQPPPIVQRHSRTLGPSVCPQGPPPRGSCWGPKHGPLSGRAGGGGSCSWGIRKLLRREP